MLFFWDNLYHVSSNSLVCACWYMWPVASKWTCRWYDSKLSYWYQFKEHMLSFKMVHRWRKSDFGNSRIQEAYLFVLFSLYFTNFTDLYLKTVFADNMSFLTRRVTYVAQKKIRPTPWHSNQIFTDWLIRIVVLSCFHTISHSNQYALNHALIGGCGSR